MPNFTRYLSIIATFIALSHSMPYQGSIRLGQNFSGSISPDEEHSHTVCDGKTWTSTTDRAAAVAMAISWCDDHVDVPKGANYWTSGSVEAWICNYSGPTPCSSNSRGAYGPEIQWVEDQCGDLQGGWHNMGDGNPGNHYLVWGIDPSGTTNC